jgi:antitoxin (DNA-binding transcriptional repressor) of toxin-antitoxin stability system
MIQVDIFQIQADLAHYLEQVARGETIVVTRDDEPIAEFRPVSAAQKKPRPLGLGKGLGTISPKFFEPLPDDLLDAFYGAPS